MDLTWEPEALPLAPAQADLAIRPLYPLSNLEVPQIFSLQAPSWPLAPGPPGAPGGQQAEWLHARFLEAKAWISRLSFAIYLPCDLERVSYPQGASVSTLTKSVICINLT